jgi:hypothetical protein
MTLLPAYIIAVCCRDVKQKTMAAKKIDLSETLPITLKMLSLLQLIYITYDT